MKKLLSILICVVLGVSGVHAAKLTINAKAYVYSSTGGQVAANQSTTTPTSDWGTSATGKFTKDADKTGFLGYGSTWNGYTLYYHAKSLQGYTFMGWSNDNNESYEHNGLCYDASSTESLTADRWNAKTVDAVTRYAIFKPIIDFPLTNEIVLYKTPQGTLSTDSLEITLRKTTGLTISCNSDLFTVSKTENFTEGYARISVAKNASATGDIELGEKQYTITLTPSNSSLIRQEYYPKTETIYITVRESPIITFKPAVVGGSYTYQQVNVGGGVVPVTQELSLGTLSMSEGTIQLVATHATNYRFKKWIITETNTDGTTTTTEFKDATKTYAFTKNAVVEAEFIEDKYARFAIKGVDGIFYDDLTEGIAAAQSSESKILYVYQSGDLATGNYTITNGVTLLVPGDDALTAPNGNLTASDCGSSSSNTCKRYLKMEENTTIMVSSGASLVVYAKLSYTQTLNGMPYSFGRIEMAKDCHIDIQSGAVLYALGYITGDPTQSGVTIRSGAKMYESFQLRDWRGGSATFEVTEQNMLGVGGTVLLGGDVNISSSSKKVFPLGQYYLQTVETKLILESGAEALVSTVAQLSLSELGSFTIVANAPFIVPDNNNYPSGFFRLGNNTQLIKYYDRAKDRQVFKFEGIGDNAKAQFGILKLSFPLEGRSSKVNISSEGFVLPIANNIDVTLDNIEVTVSYDLNLLGDASVTINKEATLNINSNVYIYDVEESQGLWYGGTKKNATILPLKYTFEDDQYLKDASGNKISSKDATLPKYPNMFTANAGNLFKRQIYDIPTETNDIPMRDATLVVDGNLIVNGHLYTTTSGANITSTGGGKVTFNQVDHSTENKLYRYLQSKEPIPNTTDSLQIGFHAIPVTNAKLHNDEKKNPDKPYEAGADAKAGDVYTYVQSLGKWMLPQKLQITNATDTVFNLTLPEDLTQNVICDVDTKSPNVSLNNFEVILPANTRFTMGDVKYENNQLIIPLTYDAQNVHNADNPYEETITVRCKDIASGTFTDVPIKLIAKENYQPIFKVTIDGKDYSDGSTYPLISGVNVDGEKSFNVKVSADANNVANALAEWTKACVAPFTFDYGTKTETPYENATFKYQPTTAGSHTGDLSITATYTDAAGVKKDSTITIHFSAVANRLSNPLAFAPFPQPIYTTTSAFELIDAATNLSGADIDVTPKTGVVEITGTGKLDDPYIVTPKSVGAVTITATQKESRVYDYKEISTTISILAGISSVPFCVSELNDFNNLLFNSTNVSYNTTNNTIDFNSTTANSEWVFRFKGTPDKLTFTPIGNNVWNIQQRSSEDADWQNILVWSSLTSGEEVSFQLKPTTCQVRIQYGSAIPEIGTLIGVCVSELRIAADANKVYMPIKAGDTSEKKVVLTHTKNAVPTISLSEGLSYTAEKSDNLGTEDAPYYKTTITLQTTESTTEKEYTLTATEDGTTITVIISAYQFPQELPIKLATDKPDNGDRYYFVTTASNHVQWDAANRQVVFQNPGTQQTRTVTFAFNGAPSIISFDAYSTDGAEVIVDSVWTIEESVNGVDFYPTTLARDSVESNKLMQELNYTTRYVRVKYNSILLREIRLSNLVIEGYPKVIVTPESMRFTTDETDLNPKKLEVIAINLQELSFELENTNAFQISMDTAYATTDWHDELTATEETHESALGKNKVDTIFLGVKWMQKTALDEGKITIRNKKDNSILAVVPIIGSEGYLTKDNAINTGLFTGIPAGYTYHGKEYKDYPYHQVNLTNAFDRDGIAMFDYLFIYGETTPADDTDITLPMGGSADGSKNIGSNAVTPYYIYKKALNSENQYKGYQYVGKIDNANIAEKAVVGDVIVKDTAGTVYIDVKKKNLKVYMTGFAPYATTGYTKNQEGVFLFRGNHGDTLDVYLEDFHVSSRNKTQNGNGFYGDKEGGEVFTDGYARGSGGVLVFENVDPQEQLQNFDPFEVTIHTIGDNLLNSNYGCFFGLSIIQGSGIAMKATQVSSPIHVHEFNKDYARKTKVTLNFTDEWPTAVNADNAVIESKRTNGFLALKKQANNAPSIDMGNKYTTVNFKGGRVELQNSQIGSDTYKTTLAISHRSGYFGSDDAGIQLCYGIGTDSVGGTVNFLDGTVTVRPMYVAPAYRQYYLMDVTYDAQGDTARDASGNVVYSDSTSCLRTPMNTYVKGGSICRVRACQHVTSKGGAPKDRERGSYLGQYVYTLQADQDTIAATTKLAHIVGFPGNVQGLETYYSSSGYTYGLNSVTPDKNNQCYFWIPDGLGGVTAEQDKLTSIWKACMTEIRAGIPKIAEGTIGGDTPIEPTEEVKYFLYCKIDEDIKDVIKAGKKNDAGEVVDYTYLPPFEVPSAAKSLFKDAEYARYDVLQHVSDSLQYQVVSDTAYTITDRVYYITTATADIWQTFTAPFDVANIYVMETYSENELKEVGTRAEILKAQAAHNADFAAFFGVAMAMGTDKSFDGIYDSYIKWAKSQDKDTLGIWDGTGTYTLRGKQKLVPYVGSNWRDANFYLNENKGNWTLNEETGYFDVNWEMLTVDSLVKDTLLHKGKTYSLMFPYCPNCEADGSLDSRKDWDYWSGKFLIFESTAGAQVINGRDFLNDTIAGHIFTQAPGETEVVVTGNSTFARLETNRENLYVYESGYPTMNSEMFLPPVEDAIVQPTTTFLYGYVPNNEHGMPAKAISRTGQIIYDKENTPTDVNQGGNIPTVGGGNDLFITSTVEGINIAVAEPQHVRVLSSTGAVLFSGMVQTAVDVALPTTGVYVITGENEVHKILH